MIRNAEFSQTEDGNVESEAGNVVTMLESERVEDKNDNDVTGQQGRFLRREPIVLISIVCLSLLNGITMAVRTSSRYEMPYLIMVLLNISSTILPVVGSIFTAFLSKVAGRKPVYMYLFALSTLSSILHVSSNYPYVVSLTLILQGIVKGGTEVMNGLAICEYSSPKHRFSWMLAHVAIRQTVSYTSTFMTSATNSASTAMTSDTNVASNVLIVVQIVLSLMCLGSTWVWPESPYWLASKGKLEESRKAFLFLRGEESRKELRSVLEARRRPGPPRLFWTGLGLAVATMSVTLFSSLQAIRSDLFYSVEDTFKPQFIIACSVVVYCAIAIMSYITKRKIIFIVFSGSTFILYNVLALWMYHLESGNLDNISLYVVFIVSDVLNRCGILALGVIMFIEIVPFKYNTVISCICFIVYYLLVLVLYRVHVYLEFYLSLDPAPFLAVYTTLSLFGALIYYFFAPETKGKTLLEIQRTYTPDENVSNPEQHLSMMPNIK